MFFCFTLVILTSAARCFAEITTFPSLQGLSIGDTCVFRWTISGSINGFKISNQTTGSPNTLRTGTSSTYNANNGDIILIIFNIQLWDAGNYWLTTTGHSSNVDFSSWLFIYGDPLVSVYLSSGTNPATEGDTVEFTCNVISTSLPAAYRPRMYTFWHTSNFGWLPLIFSGPAVDFNGNIIPRHSIKNDGRTLVIDSIKYGDPLNIICRAREDGASYGDYVYMADYNLMMRYRPYIYYVTPPSMKKTATIVSNVFFWFSWESLPSGTSTNWSFTDTQGIQQNLPLDSQEYYLGSESGLTFNFTTSAYYGKYSITLTNTLGSTVVEFQVLPTGVPDTPSNLQIVYISHSTISVNWNLMFANSIDHLQTVFVILISTATGTEIDMQYRSVQFDIYNVTYNNVFQKNIQPNSSYEIRVWSINVFGRSGVATLPVRTRKAPQLNVSPETILINGSQATINFTLTGDDIDNITGVNATCCLGQAGPCVNVNSSIQGTAAPNQIVINDIPVGTDYFFDLTIYCGVYGRYSYLSAMAKCIKVSRSGNLQSEEIETTVTSQTTTVNSHGENNKCISIAVIVLVALLGIDASGFIGACIACLCMKSRASIDDNEQNR